MSVEEAEAYSQKHKIADRLTEAINSALAEQPEGAGAPLLHMARVLREKAGAPPAEPPSPTSGVALSPGTAEYLKKHELNEVMQQAISSLVEAMPEEPIEFLALALEAKASALYVGTPSFTNVADVRSAFINYFKDDCAHTFWPSSPVAPLDDPTLLFINSGMAQFKPHFLGRCDPNSAMSKLKRAANTQKCIRAGGKHNDLDDVGKDNYHHTFFEMLGNWSFGDYFKEEAIKWSWTLLTEVYKIPKDRLYVTYFEGNEAQGVPADLEAREIWAKYVPRERILAGNMKDNFWEMGDTGPCGPCSEIHYDRIGGRDAAHLVNDGCVGRNGQPIPKKGTVVKGHTVGVADPNVLEIWNNVFMQFNREKDGSLTPLPKPCVDTGMGLERVSSILLGKRSNYQIDVFTTTFEAIHKLAPAGTKPYEDKYGAEDPDGVFMAYRVVADHIRTLTFSLTDGATPSSEGRGYVLRRILRRAVRYGSEKLNMPEGFFAQLVDSLVACMGGAFPELAKDPERVKAILREEEEIFSRTLKKGILELDKRCKKLGGATVLPGDDAFRMYDTYGFPLDLTVLMCEEKGLSVDTAGYESEMAKAVEQARKGGNFNADEAIDVAADEVDTLKTKMGLPPTDDMPKYTWDSAAGTGGPLGSKLRAILNVKKVFLDEASAASGLVGVVTDATSFYAEAGGQVADTGTIVSAEGASLAVESVQKYGAYVLHIGKMTVGTLKLGDEISLQVDYARRALIAKNHTATHMLNLAIKGALGMACDQRGSLCDADKYRFDFAYGKPLTMDELLATQKHVNEQIAAALPVQIQVTGLEGAKTIRGLRAVFGEQYPDPVRVVCVGGPGVQQMLDAPDTPEWETYSAEFCGGTHIGNSKEIEHFVLLSEEGLGRGVRRVLGVTFEKAKAAFAEAESLKSRFDKAESLSGDALVAENTELLKLLETAIIPVVDRKTLQDKIMVLKKKVVDAEKEAAKAGAGAAKEEAEALADGAAATPTAPLVALLAAEADAKGLEGAMSVVTAKVPGAPVMLIGKGKALAALAVVPPELEAKLNAKDWINAALECAGGKGGGKAGRAQGAARDAANAAEAAEAAKKYVAEKLG
jgi:alanyl-tRNA synthetase